MKKMVTLLLAGMMSFSLMACVGGEESTDVSEAEPTATKTAADDDTEDENFRVMLVSYDQSQFPMVEYSGVEAAAEELGFEAVFQSPSTYPDLASQINIIETAAADGVDAVIVHPVDSEGICATLQKVADKGVAVFIVDTNVADTTGTVAFFGANNEEYGAACADAMAEELGGEGQVAVLSSNEASLAHSLRRDGFVGKVESDYPGIEIVDIQYDNNDALKANQLASSFILTYPELDGIYCTGDVEGNGAISALQENNAVGKYTIIGSNSGKSHNDAIRNGVLNGCVMQNAYGFGYYSAKAAYEYVQNGTEPEEYLNYIPLKYITADNIDSEEAKQYLYD